MEVYIMRTNIVLEDEILKEAFKISNIKTKKELINIALIEFVQNRKKMNLIDLKGKIRFADDYNYKKLREGN
jgi:Arc/MetJ family transcription regulator